MSDVFPAKRRTLGKLTKRQQAVLDGNRKAAQQAREMAARERAEHAAKVEQAGEWLRAAREDAGNRCGT